MQKSTSIESFIHGFEYSVEKLWANKRLVRAVRGEPGEPLMKMFSMQLEKNMKGNVNNY